MQIDDAGLVERAVQPVDVVGELDAVVLDDVRCAADAGGCVVAVLGDFIACAGDDEAGGGRYVERVLAVAAGAHHVDVAVAVEDGGHAGLQYAVAESQQLVNRHAAHLQAGQQGGNLLVGVFALRDTNEDGLHLLAGELFVIQQAEEIAFHSLFHIVCFYVF